MKPSLAKNSLFNVAYQLVLVLVPLISSMYVSRVVLPEALGGGLGCEQPCLLFRCSRPVGHPRLWGSRDCEGG